MVSPSNAHRGINGVSSEKSENFKKADGMEYFNPYHLFF